MSFPCVIPEEVIKKYVDASFEKASENFTGSNENFLHNPFFTLNSRGQNSYTGNTNYTVDRWVLATDNITLTLNDDKTISLATSNTEIGVFVQGVNIPLSALIGKTVTASIMKADGTILSGTTTIASSMDTSVITDNVSESETMSCNLLDYNGALHFRLLGYPNSTAYTIKAVKLELGTRSTLHLDTVPNAGEELLKCWTATADPSDTLSNMIILNSQNYANYALPRAGGSIYNTLVIDNNDGATFEVKRSSASARARMYASANGEAALQVVDSTNSNSWRSLYIAKPSEAIEDALHFVSNNDGSGIGYKLYGEHNITVSTSAPTSALAEGCMHMTY